MPGGAGAAAGEIPGRAQGGGGGRGGEQHSLGLVESPHRGPQHRPEAAPGHHQDLRGAGEAGEPAGGEVRPAQAAQGLSGGAGRTHSGLLSARLQTHQ